MAGAMRKMGVYLGLVEDDDRRGRSATTRSTTSTRRPRSCRSGGSPPVAAAGRTPPSPGRRSPHHDGYREPVYRDAPEEPTSYRITTLHPRTYNEARTIGEHFREGVPVIMNLTEMDDADAKRLVDFAAGLSFGLRGSIERVTNKVFLLSPQNVHVTAEDKARIAEGGFFNQS